MDGLYSHLSKCEYYLRKPHEGFTNSDFEKIRAAAMEWARNEEVDIELEKTEDGFIVTFRLTVDDEEAYCMSFYLHLASDTFLHLENQGLWMAHHHV